MRIHKRYKCVVCGTTYIGKDRNYRPTCSLKCGLRRAYATAMGMSAASKIALKIRKQVDKKLRKVNRGCKRDSEGS